LLYGVIILSAPLENIYILFILYKVIMKPLINQSTNLYFLAVNGYAWPFSAQFRKGQNQLWRNRGFSWTGFSTGDLTTPITWEYRKSHAFPFGRIQINFEFKLRTREANTFYPKLHEANTLLLPSDIGFKFSTWSACFIQSFNHGTTY
jgi:hypothetical protein